MKRRPAGSHPASLITSVMRRAHRTRAREEETSQNYLVVVVVIDVMESVLRTYTQARTHTHTRTHTNARTHARTHQE